MTSETRTLIGMGDVTGIEIECPECHLTILYPVAKLFKIRPQCPHCNQDWFDPIPERHSVEGAYPAIDNIQNIASHLRTFTRSDRTDIHAQVRLRINTEAKTGS